VFTPVYIYIRGRDIIIMCSTTTGIAQHVTTRRCEKAHDSKRKKVVQYYGGRNPKPMKHQTDGEITSTNAADIEGISNKMFLS